MEHADLRTMPVIDEKYTDIRHPYTSYSLGDAVALAVNNAKEFGRKVPTTLLEVRDCFVEMQSGMDHQWLTGCAALDVLDAAIDGRDINIDSRILDNGKNKVHGISPMMSGTKSAELVTTTSEAEYHLYDPLNEALYVKKSVEEIIKVAERLDAGKFSKVIQGKPVDLVNKVDGLWTRKDGTVISGSYVGKVIAIENGIATQKIGRDPDVVVKHKLSYLSAEVKNGDVVDVHYSGGVGRVLEKENNLQR